MKRKIWLDGERFVLCEITRQQGEFDYYSCPKERMVEVIEAMRYNGMLVASADGSSICVNRTKMWFQGELYNLNQCSDIFEWFQSSAFEFTYYYDRVVFHTHDGKFCAAYREDLNNYIEI